MSKGNERPPINGVKYARASEFGIHQDGSPVPVVDPWVYFRRPTEQALSSQIESEMIDAFLSARVRNPRLELSIADKIYEESHLADAPYQQGMQNLLNIALRISNIHLPIQKREVEHRRSAAVMNGIMANVFGNFTLDHYREATDERMAQLDQQMSLVLKGDRWSEWFHPKLTILRFGFESARNVSTWMDHLAASSLEVSDPEGTRAIADEMAERIRADRAYGVKTSFATSPLFLRFREVFHFVDPELFKEGNHTRVGLPDALALLGIGVVPTEEFMPDMVASAKSRNFKSNIISFRGVIGSMMLLENDGNINFGMGGSIPVRRIFEKRELGHLYEFWRLLMLTRVHELTARAEVLEGLPTASRIEDGLAQEIRRAGFVRRGFLGLTKERRKTSVNLEPFKTLVVPRVKRVDNTEMSLEEQAERQETQDAKRFMDKHRVVWFVRKLPQGYHATQRAMDYALEHGVTLRENETIVRDHWRGTNIGESRPTKLASRRSK